jgi:formylglycine-generating enzyme required for sulfatase activity
MLGFVYIRSEERREIGAWHRTPTGSPEVIRDEGSETEISYEGSPTLRLYVAKYPVTVAQFRTFTETTGFRVRDPNALCDPGSRPVRFVSWHDALAYCNWLNALLSSVSALRGYEVSRLVREEGWQVALPSEVEWEMAARGIPPHGVQPPAMESTSVSGNYRDLGIGTTSVVGCFPFNRFGIYDMAGNLWEWTRSPWESSAESSNATEDRKPEGVIAGDRIFRIVRGGSWDDNRGIDPHGMRGRAPPESVGLNVGFRVVLRPPLSP